MKLPNSYPAFHQIQCLML